MKAVNYSDFRQHLKSHLDIAYSDHEPLIVTRKQNENMVVMSQEDYNSLMETVYLLSSKTNANRLYESRKQTRTGKKISVNVNELDEMKEE
jgi:antitoxin YefM